MLRVVYFRPHDPSLNISRFDLNDSRIMMVLRKTTARMQVERFDLALDFKLLAQLGIEEMFQGHVYKSTRSDHFNDIRLLLQGLPCLVHCPFSFVSLTAPANQASWH